VAIDIEFLPVKKIPLGIRQPDNPLNHLTHCCSLRFVGSEASFVRRGSQQVGIARQHPFFALLVEDGKRNNWGQTTVFHHS
jgi:hypothetical protein